MSFQEKLGQIMDDGRILYMEPMSRHTTFRIGGPAEYYLQPKETEVADLLSLCKQEKVPFTIIGNGSNLLVGDGGIEGAVIEIGTRMSEISVEGETLSAQGGASLIRLARKAADQGWTGLEFASGIPGTIGGAIAMNAGAYGGEIKDVLLWADVLLPDGTVEKMDVRDLELSYRHSILSENGGIVLRACFGLKPGNRDAIEQRMEELREQRISKQPLEFPSAGSTFKRPEGYFAGKLIQDAGLLGYRVGDAQVSEKHGGFVINRGGATAKEVSSLMTEVSRIVQEKFGVTLEPEVKRIGLF